MSQEAYELLLQANNLFSEERKVEAVQAYREVLRLDPTPNQRQVAEAQLRAMGELPHTFSSSGKVIRRHSNQEGNPTKPLRRKPRKGQPNVGQDNRRARGGPGPRPSRPGPSPERTTRTFRDSGMKPSNGSSEAAETMSLPPIPPPMFPEPDLEPPLDVVSHEGHPKPPIKGRRPPRPVRPRRGAVMEGRYRRQRGKWDQTDPPSHHLPKTQTEKHLEKLDQMYGDPPPVAEPPPPSAGLPASTPAPIRRVERKTPKKPAVVKKESDPQSSLPQVKKPKPPKRRKGESASSYEERLGRYDIWMKHRETHPDIDLNTAVRLEETGWSIEELRAKQVKRRDKYLDRKKRFYDEKVEENKEFSGTQYVDNLVRDKVPVWVRGGHLFEEKCTLTKNALYLWRVQLLDGVKTFWPKLQIECMAELDFLPTVQSLCFVDPEQAGKKEPIPEVAEERFEVPDDKLLHSLENEEPLAIQLYSGMWCHGWVYWYDPYQLSVVLNIDCGEDEDLQELILFRHAIKSVLARRPNGWKSMPKLGEYLEAQDDSVPSEEPAEVTP
ncbi:MAG: hypothetical protein EP343_13690 [Deltaproteobacteria bacterium]|nr:MAG: hypothetical protein EP343_13690 [Deltaproteobacteria bacterium]